MAANYNFNQTYTQTVSFYQDIIDTTITADPVVASQWISDVESIHRTQNARNLIVGLDVEWRPSYSPISNPVATLQLCVDRRCLIFHLIHCAYIPSALIGFLANTFCTFVGVGIKADLDKLKNDYSIGCHNNGVDLREWAADEYGRQYEHLKRAGVKALVEFILGKEVEKPRNVTMSAWDNRWLMESQIRYACIDAFVCSEMGRMLGGIPSSQH